jgi:hypothetical protein
MWFGVGFFWGGGNESQNRDILSRGTFYLAGSKRSLKVHVLYIGASKAGILGANDTVP